MSLLVALAGVAAAEVAAPTEADWLAAVRAADPASRDGAFALLAEGSSRRELNSDEVEASDLKSEIEKFGVATGSSAESEPFGVATASSHEELHAERELLTEKKTRKLQRKLPKLKTKRERVFRREDAKVKKVEDALGLPYSVLGDAGPVDGHIAERR